MRSFAVLLVLCVAVAAVMAREPAPKMPIGAAARRVAFEEWKQQYGVTYASEAAHELKFQIFSDNMDRIEKMNSLHTRAAFGLNKFADLSREEFKSMYLSKTPYPAEQKGAGVAPLYSKAELAAIPKSVDWRTKGAVTPVKNQGACGSCWSFSTTGNVEGQWFLANKTNGGPIVGLSEQNLVDCDHQCTIYDGQQSCDSGCDGGLQPNAYTYIIKNNGIDTEESYPYEGYDDTCRYSVKNRGAQISNWTFVSKDEQQMAAYCAQHGPLAIAADAQEWQFYVWGVFEGPCGTSLDHGILIVGYGTEIDELGFSIDYWIVKNSWGADWGLAGYLWIVRGVGECGLNTYVTSSIIN